MLLFTSYKEHEVIVVENKLSLKLFKDALMLHGFYFKANFKNPKETLAKPGK